MSDPITRLNEALEGRYRIERELGEGGMATVYLARDLRHDRQVAIKVLKPALAAALGSERFLTEIRTTAGLQHPHILPLHDSGDADGFLFYVMPYVDGETLRARIDRERQLPVEDAVSIAVKVAGALQAAHERGVVHRDVKPENILLSANGEPLVSDFGIALAIDAAGGERLTETGLTLGTPLYMSPEQTTGEQEAGPPSDIYALGCVLYEMLAGEPPHAGPTAQAVLANILTAEPPSVTDKRRTVPRGVSLAVQRSLEGLPADRFRTMADFAAALAEKERPSGAAMPGGRRAIAWAAVIAAVTLVGAALAWLGLRGPTGVDQPVVRYTLAIPDGEGLVPTGGNSVALSPDGGTLVYVGPIAGEERHWSETDRQLWIRERSDQIRGRALDGTVGARTPFFSPEGDRLGFVTSAGGIKVVRVDGGSPVSLVDSGVNPGREATWGDDGYIYYSRTTGRGLVRMPASGGAPEPVTTEDLGPEVLGHTRPQLLPDGAGLLFAIKRNHVADDIAVIDLRTGEQRILTPGVAAVYAETGHVIWVEQDGTLLAAPLDPRRLELTSEGVVLGQLSVTYAPDLALSRSGRLVYTASPSLVQRVVWVERDGSESTIDPANPMEGIRFVALSPDGTRLAVNTYPRPPSDDGDVFVKDLPAGAYQRVTFEGAVNFRPEWSPDGQSLTFVSDRRGDRDVWTKRVDGVGGARLVYDAEISVDEARISPDGEWLVYRRGMENGQRDIYALRLGREEIGRPIIDSEFDAAGPLLSPDGRWIAFALAEPGGANVYVRPFPEADRQWRISPNGGQGPVWSDDEIFYRNGNDQMVAVRYEGGETFTYGEEEALFSTGNYRSDYYHRSYDVTPDGQRFVMIRALENEPGVLDVVIVENWFRELREAMASAGR